MIVTDFNYMLLMGNSGQGKTTYAKHVVSRLKKKGHEVIVFDPNVQWWDLADQEIGPRDLLYAVNRVGKALAFRGKQGVLIIEDYKLTLSSVARAMEMPLSRVRAQIRELLENVRKYRLKVILLAHLIDAQEIDPTTLGMFQNDTVVFFNTALTNYRIRQIAELGYDGHNIRGLSPFSYIVYNGVGPIEGVVQKHRSHVKVESSGDFQVTRLLKGCKSKSEMILVLKAQTGQSHQEVADTLKRNGITLGSDPQNNIRVALSRWRGRMRRKGIDPEEIIPRENVTDFTLLIT